MLKNYEEVRIFSRDSNLGQHSFFRFDSMQINGFGFEKIDFLINERIQFDSLIKSNPGLTILICLFVYNSFNK